MVRFYQTLPKTWREFIKVHEAASTFPMGSDDELRELGEDIKANGLILPIVFTRDWQLIDGRSRLEACERAGFKIVPAGYLPGGDVPLNIEGLPAGKASSGIRTPSQISIITNVDPYLYAISANIHRRHPTPEQKREFVAKLLMARPEMSNRETAKLAKVSATTVGSIRLELEAGDQTGHLEKRTGADGKSYPAHTPQKPPREGSIRITSEGGSGSPLRGLYRMEPSPPPPTRIVNNDPPASEQTRRLTTDPLWKWNYGLKGLQSVERQLRREPAPKFLSAVRLAIDLAKIEIDGLKSATAAKPKKPPLGVVH